MSRVVFCHGCLKVWDMNKSPDQCVCNPELVYAIRSTSVEMLTPEQWAAQEDVKIIDPDGWRYDGKSFQNEICYDEWVWRRNRSTISLRNLPGQQRLPV